MAWPFGIDGHVQPGRPFWRLEAGSFPLGLAVLFNALLLGCMGMVF
ncbi:MAG: hypothetical protein ACK5N0_00340 [Synechococcaceae cyanobacterium]